LARILYVDDEEFWRDFITRALRDHHVDAVGSLQAAIDLLKSEPAYAVALVDLNLHDDGDGEGGELLDLLCLRYPATQRVVVTGNPPGGDVWKRVVTAYDAKALIIKANFQLPDLRRVVEEAIAVQPGEIPQSLRLNRWVLRQRFRDWHRSQSDRLDDELNAAEKHLSDTAKLGPQTRQHAEDAVVSARTRKEQFRDLSTRLREVVFGINTEADLDAALEALEKAEDQFGEDADGHSRP
jgi:CheY-like chemotaxis protein